jgi:hypothetical protein
MEGDGEPRFWAEDEVADKLAWHFYALRGTPFNRTR